MYVPCAPASSGTLRVELRREGCAPAAAEASFYVLQGWTTLLPPLLTLGAAVLTRRVLPSLLLGLGCAAYWADGWNKLDGSIVLMSVLEMALAAFASSVPMSTTSISVSPDRDCAVQIAASTLLAQEPSPSTRALTSKDAFEEFERAQGGDWVVKWLPATGTPSTIYGTGLEIADWGRNSLQEGRRCANQHR